MTTIVFNQWRQQLDFVEVMCPRCGTWQVIDHEIRSDGTLWPSVRCIRKDCGFEDRCRLEGWVEMVFV